MKLKFMKCFFRAFLVFFILSSHIHAKEFNNTYTVTTRGITIGSLKWDLELNETNYKTKMHLYGHGIFSALYKFEGIYSSVGRVSNGDLYPQEYNQMWNTKKKSRNIQIKFKNKKVLNLQITPEEKELSRIDVRNLFGYSDPITSFIKILISKRASQTIDGRRIYTLSPGSEKINYKIQIKKYKNIWADHKRNDLEYIEIFNDKDISFLPKKIKIRFKGSTFTLK